MFEPPDHYQNLSLLLSEALDEIGVNQEVVMKRRRACMLMETMDYINRQLNNKKWTNFRFGSQTEGSTTAGLNSDIDSLMCFHDIRLIQDWCDWEPVTDKLQLLMIQDDTTSPGYCLLQRVRHDEPLPVQDFNDEHFSTDDRGRVLMRHSMFIRDIRHDGRIRHGPAFATYGNYINSDIVPAIQCLSWPKESNAWLHQHNASGWPTEDMKRYSAEQGCLVVPVDSKTGVYPDLEWRISTSLAERCLMWGLNITQIRCYILMKMIVKTFLKPVCDEAISSFICKTILFHSIANSAPNSTWNESTLFFRLNQCLQTLFQCILTENCPHFITPASNLLAGKLSAEFKRMLADVMCNLTGNIEQSLLSIDIDDLGQRLQVKMGRISRVYLQSADTPSFPIVINNIHNLTTYLSMIINGILKTNQHNSVSVYNHLTTAVSKLCQLHYDCSGLERVAINLLTPFLCTTIGFIIASLEITSSGVISPMALNWFSLGLNSDISSGRLKLASALYCAGDLLSCEIILDDVIEKMSHTSVRVNCYCNAENSFPEGFLEAVYEKNEDVIKFNIAFCVSYLPCEVNCIPKELKYEMFRSTEEDRPYRSQDDDDWMDWAVVDSLPYLHFLQYKVYNQLQRQDDKLRALHNLAETINTEDSIGHKETALNLLGQCMEQENRMHDALFCYIMSLNIRERNNAAKLHICRMLARHFRQ